MPYGVDVTQPRGRIAAYLDECPVDEVETFKELGDVLQTSTTLKIEETERHDWRRAEGDLRMGETEEYFDSRWYLSNSIEKVRSLDFRAGDQTSPRRSVRRLRIENCRYLLLKPEANGSRSALDLLGIKHYAGHH
jgi:hypothetical protein